MKPDDDPLYDKAVMIAKANPGRICIARIQRHLLIGYNRASRLMDSMIEAGLIERYEAQEGNGYGYRLITPNVEVRGEQLAASPSETK